MKKIAVLCLALCLACTFGASADTSFMLPAEGLTGTFGVTVTLDENGVITGISLGDTNSEMDVPYLDLVKSSDTFLSNFIGQSQEIKGIDAVTGATVSSNAVIAAANEAFVSFLEYDPDSITVEANGLTGTFPVTVIINETGAVTGVALGDASSEMDIPYLDMIKSSETFLGQFIGKADVIAESDIDVVTGATTSSMAVLGVVNQLLDASAGSKAITRAVSGLTGLFEVTVYLDENGAVSEVVLGDTASEMDVPYLTLLKDSGTFLSQFAGKTGEIADSDIDVVTGATTSSMAVLEAVNEALAAN